MNKRPINLKTVKVMLARAMEGLPIDDEKALSDAIVYLEMTDEGFKALPAFWEDGTVRFYEVGPVVLGKNALTKFVEAVRNK